ncbi:intradiol ring-cleavage dioxygenase [Herbidospora galbida]|uniref:Intradiol ring-cleavage dioxygenase n=1 Tax=Herbidospora galbida TaxID=2575442 RepID=A0A4U3LNU2_9ACTN|nr:intradiol ring-cleavage dioxygenase [Herbidospora galbida]TKK77302.1 intradiol ring-cleavage dioxygenase [Herbidospora galbida]
MTDHDEGNRVSRRTMIAGVGSIGLGTLLAACGSGGPAPVTTSTGATATITPRAATGDLTALFESSGTCVLTPSTTPGPYYFDADRIRSDIREDRPGTRLDLAIRVRDSETCAPLKDAVVEIWHCDAGGLYSGAESASTGGPGGGGGGDLVPADGNRYLRGAQVTNADGIVTFTTIWPGWYPGRTVHVHAMVHVGGDRTLTTQVMFDEALNDAVLAAEPYAGRGGRDTRNENDSIFQAAMVMKTVRAGDGHRGAITFDADPDRNGR